MLFDMFVNYSKIVKNWSSTSQIGQQDRDKLSQTPVINIRLNTIFVVDTLNMHQNRVEQQFSTILYMPSHLGPSLTLYLK